MLQLHCLIAPAPGCLARPYDQWREEVGVLQDGRHYKVRRLPPLTHSCSRTR